MIDIPSSLTDGDSVYLGDKRFVYNGGKLVPYVVTNVGTELTSPKLNVETLTEFRHSVSGKPLYTKTIDCGFLPATKTYKLVPLNIVDDYDYVKVLVEASHIVIPDVKNFSFSVLMPWYTLESQIGTYIDAGNIVIGVGSGHSNKKAYITVEYTKTADTSSSPVKSLYTGSLNEIRQNVETHAGYRRNGKDVYQIEVDFGVLPNNTTKTVGIPNYNALYTYWLYTADSYAFRGDTNVRIPIPYSATINGIDYSASPFINNNSISIITYSDRSAFGISKIILHYTK